MDSALDITSSVDSPQEPRHDFLYASPVWTGVLGLLGDGLLLLVWQITDTRPQVPPQPAGTAPGAGTRPFTDGVTPPDSPRPHAC